MQIYKKCNKKWCCFVCFFILPSIGFDTILHPLLSANFEYYMTSHAAIIITKPSSYVSSPNIIFYVFSFCSPSLCAMKLFFMRNEYLFMLCFHFLSPFWLMEEKRCSGWRSGEMRHGGRQRSAFVFLRLVCHSGSSNLIKCTLGKQLQIIFREVG